MTEEQSEMFYEEGFTVIEEDFKNETLCYTVYADENFSERLAELGLEYKVCDVDDTGWEENWKNYIQPGWLTDDIYFCFDNEKFDDGRMILRINPSLAFGTGSHGTTRVAAGLLCEVAEGKTVIDAGCGSGILAIAASLKGAKKVYAFDNDSVALNNTYENIKLNNRKNVFAWAGTSESMKIINPEIYCANIITSVLKIIHPDALAQNPDYIVYSGILTEEYEEFMESLDLTGYTIEKTASINEWTGVRLKKCTQ